MRKLKAKSQAWKTVRVAQIADSIQYGHTASAISRKFGPRFLRITDIQNGAVDWDSVPSCDIVAEDIPKYRLSAGDLVFARTGATTGKSFLIRKCPDAVFASYLIRVRASKNVDPRYLAFFFQSPDYWRQIEQGKRGIGQPNVNGKTLGEVQLPLPPLDEQQRIVAEIEKQFTRLDAGVGSLKRVQAALKRYRASVLKAACEGGLVPTEAELARKENRSYETGEQLLQRILKDRREKWNGKGKYKEPVDPNVIALPKLPDGWTWCMSDALFTFVTSGSRGWAKYHSQTGPLFLRIGNLNHQDIRLDVKDIQHVDPPKGAEGTRTVVQSGDILVSITADIGMIAVVPENLGEAYINQHVALARPTASIFTEYVAHYLSASEGGWRHLKKLQRGATKVGLGLDDIRSVPIPLPPLAEQKRIVTELERRLSVIEELEVIISTELQRAVRLRQSILAAAFCGERRVWEKVLLAETEAKVHT